jgi:hypothetical protein
VWRYKNDTEMEKELSKKGVTNVRETQDLFTTAKVHRTSSGRPCVEFSVVGFKFVIPSHFLKELAAKAEALPKGEE